MLSRIALRKYASAAVKRPLSPHLTIYQPQLTWLLSISYRVSGVVLSLCACALLENPANSWI